MSLQRLQNLFAQKNNDLLSIYLTAGYPTIDAMPQLIRLLSEHSVDFIEAGMPFSDPLADGTTIQNSSSKALQNGMTLSLYFEQIQQARLHTDLPILFMGYFNQLLKYGVEPFLHKCVQTGIDALILPDLPPEVYEKKYQKLFEKYDLGISFLITPQTSLQRIQYIDRLSSAFIYVVSASSTTGKTGAFTPEQIDYLKRIQKIKTIHPKITGFGIDNAEKFQIVNTYTNGAIIGSAFIKAIAEPSEYQQNAVRFIQKIKGNMPEKDADFSEKV